MGQNERILVVGATGLIGKALKQYWIGQGKDVIGTSRHKELAGRGYLYLDLSADVAGWEIPDGINAAVICAGIGKVSQCEQDPAMTARINVQGTVAIVKKLVERGVFVLILSSNQVFDGKKPFSVCEAPFSPISEYGRQKVALERAVRSFTDSLAVVRLTKVLTADNDLFVSWRNSMQQSRSINPFVDVYFSPTTLATVVSIFDQIVARRLGGVFQVSGSDEISYAEAAVLYAQSLGLPQGLIRPINVSEVESLCGILPRHGSLNTDRLKIELGRQMADSEAVIKSIVEQDIWQSTSAA